MRQGVIGGIVGVVFGAAAILGIGAFSDDGRDACAKLADLSSATTIGTNDDVFLAALDRNESLLNDCLNE